jgi:hypothetical protein
MKKDVFIAYYKQQAAVELRPIFWSWRAEVVHPRMGNRCFKTKPPIGIRR